MTDTRDIILGGRKFGVPPLPHRLNRRAYPLCRDLVAGGLVDRCAAAHTDLAVSDTELAALSDLCRLAVQAAQPDMTDEAFDDMPITPIEMVSAFFEIMAQTGAYGGAAAPAP